MGLYQQFMIKPLIVLIVNALLVHRIAGDQPMYQLSPILPPSAFLGQPYTCKFQVTGVKLPKFTFEGFPKEFTTQASGLVTGVPLQVGSYLVTITYSSYSYTQSQQTILRITTPNALVRTSSLYPAFSISASINSFVFMAGTKVEISFSATMGSPPYQWAYLRLPSELSGTKDGLVTGYFEMEGYYSFGVTCADSLGKSTDSYFTLNIQPFTFFFNWAPQALRPIVNVLNRDYYNQSAKQLIWLADKSAQNDLIEAAKNASKAQSLLSDAERNMAKANYTLLLAKQYLSSAENQLAEANNKKTFAEKYFQKATLDLQTINRTLQEKIYSLQQASHSKIKANQTMLKLQKEFDKLSQDLQNASNQLINAQNLRANASSSYKQAEMIYSEAEMSRNLSLSSQVLAQKQYEGLLPTILKLTANVDLAQREVVESKKMNNLASEALSNMTKLANDATQVLKNANDQVYSLKQEASKAMDSLGQAKFNLTLAENQLYVAHAVKAQVIRTAYLINSQAPPPSCPSPFAGCSQLSYPSTFGTAQVKEKTSQSIVLLTGQNLLLGPCTSSVPFQIGDLITFEGYLKDGCIHLIRFTQSQSI